MSDGDVIQVYEASNKQMYEQPVDKSQYPAALSFLTGTGKLSDSFDFELFCRATSMKLPRRLRARRHAQAADAGLLEGPLLRGSRHVAGAARDGHRRPGQPEPVRLREPAGERTASPATQFTFTPPPGTSIVRPVSGR